MKIVALVQARMGSTRLPHKVMKPIAGVPMIELLLLRLARATEVDEIVLATSEDEGNDPLVAHVTGLGYACERGSENDVLDRYVRAARRHRADAVVRVTADCPLTDPALVDEAVRRFRSADVDYFSNTDPPTYPDGLDVEVCRVKALEQAAREATSIHDREHVTPFLRNSKVFKKASMTYGEDLSALRWTVDEPADLDVIEGVFRHFHPRTNFSWSEVLDLQRERPEMFESNRRLVRNAGVRQGAGQKLWARAREVIPGGSMLLSKRPEMFLPERWPAYFSRAKGCHVWDLDGRRYVDMSLMGIGTNLLGYARDEVDGAVHRAVDAGNMSTLNCPEEVTLAERLVALHPWAHMVRFARTGGEADAIAVRIARAASGRDGVAVCGYHGWHDWYLSANLGEGDALASHLLPGLDARGIPKALAETVFPFAYNDFDELARLVRSRNIGAIMMEVERTIPPRAGFLESVRKLASEAGAVLIFDECTSGFRETFGGLHLRHKVDPDMAIFGKALGNGYAITAIIGRRDVMEAAQTTFISSTFWTERIGSVAALATLDVMERSKSWEQVTQVGRDVSRRWAALADRHGLSISISGLPALSGFAFQGPKALAYKTLLVQEMLERGYLATTSLYACTEHSDAILDAYFESLDPVFGLIRQCEDGVDVIQLLGGPVCHAGLMRLN